jgi:hypothetical protein
MKGVALDKMNAHHQVSDIATLESLYGTPIGAPFE